MRRPDVLVPPRDRDVGIGVGRLPRGRVRTNARAARGRPSARHPEDRRRRPGDRDLRPAGGARPPDQGARARTARCARCRGTIDRRPAGHLPRAVRRRVHRLGDVVGVRTAATSRRWGRRRVRRRCCERHRHRTSPVTAARHVTSSSSTTSSTPSCERAAVGVASWSTSGRGPRRRCVTSGRSSPVRPRPEPIYGPPPADELLRFAVSPVRARIHLAWSPWTDLTVRSRSAPLRRGSAR